MEVIDKLEKRKNQLIYDFLNDSKEIISSEEEYEQIREKFLDVVNVLYRDAIYIIAAQRGIVVQSMETLAKQMLPKGFKVEKLIDNMDKTLKKPKKVKDIVSKNEEDVMNAD